MTDATPPPSLKVLTVCTANICRSPMAAGFLRAGAKAVDVRLRVASAGLLKSGVDVEPETAAVMAERGIDVSGHRSHQLQDVDIAAADLILTMERNHTRQVVGRDADALSKTFPILEFCDLGRRHGPPAADEPVLDWVRRLGDTPRLDRLRRSDQADDISDPYGGPRRGFEKTAEQLDRICWTVLDLLAGYRPAE